MIIRSYIKNIPGVRSKRKLVVFSVDDYGNVFLDSKKARENLRSLGLPVDQSRFSQYDILENKSDLSYLFDTLSSVQDANGYHPSFTVFAMSANIDFDAIRANNYEKYIYMSLPETFESRPGYEGTWNLWQEGIESGYLVPEFHGREHVNIRYLEDALRDKDPFVLANLENRSWAGLSFRGHVGFTEAFSFNDIAELDLHREIIKDGLELFEKTFGRKARHFNAPGAREHHSLHTTLKASGITMIDADFIKTEHQGNGIFKKLYHPFGGKNWAGLNTVFRNCVFEPSLLERSDWVDSCLKEIEIAFRCGKPANITSHRVNFVGGIEPKIREHGMRELQRLLIQIVNHWPDVEFGSSVDLIV